MCSCHGVLAQVQSDGAITEADFKQLLHDMRLRVGNNNPIYLFMDKANIHRYGGTPSALAETNIVPIYNVAF